MNSRILRSLLGLVFIGTLLAWSLPQEEIWRDKVAPAVLDLIDRGSPADVMIVLQNQADVSDAHGTKEDRAWYVFNRLQATAKQSQKDILDYLNTERVNHRSFYVINAIQLVGQYNLIKNLAQRSEVAAIHHNPTMKLNHIAEENYATSRDPEQIEWGIDMINADEVWDMGYTGQGVVVGGADTGYEWIHPALQSKYRGWDGSDADHNYNWHDAIHEISPLHNDTVILPSNNPCGLESSEPCDDHNHGTHTMGTMIGEDGENQIGVAPGASWVACRNMERGYGSPATYIECFEWFLAPTDLNDENPDPTKAPHVINNSWGCPEMEGCTPDNWSTMETVVNNLKSSGIVVVVSAGNSGGQGCSSINNPAAIFENSFTIGSTRSNDTISGFSSRGPVTVDGSDRMKPNVSAPGSQVRSSIRNGGYAAFSGTSMAGPHVAGLVALLISADPTLAGQVEEIETIIELTAVAKTTDEDCGSIAGTEVPNHTYGFGRVDALAAVEYALQASNVEESNSNVSIRTFPNPIDNEIQFEIQNLRGEIQLEIYSAAGQLLQAQQLEILSNFQLETISIPDFPKGVYFYKITYKDAAFGGKLLKR